MTLQELATRFVASVGDPDGLAPLLTDDARWWWMPSSGIDEQIGRDAIVSFQRHLYTASIKGDTVRVDVLDQTFGDDRIALRYHLTAETAADQPYDNHHAVFLRVRDGQIDHVHDHFDVAHAFALIVPSRAEFESSRIERVAPDHYKVYTSIEIDAPASRVWSVLTDFDRMPEWSSTLQGLTGDFCADGDVTAIYKAGMMRQEFRHPLVMFTDGVEFGWSAPAMPGMVDRHLFRVEGMPNDRTRFIQNDEARGTAARLMGGMIGRNMVSLYRTFNRELKAEVERQAASV